MKNNFQSNGKGRSQRVWQLLISMLFILTMGIGQMWATVTVQVGNVDAVSDKDSVYAAGYLSDGITARHLYVKSNGTYTSTNIQNTTGIDVLYGNTSTTSAKMSSTSNLGPTLVSGGKTHLQVGVENGDSVTVYWFHSSTMSNKKMIVSKVDPSNASKGVQITTVRIDLGTSKLTGCTGWKSTMDGTAYFSFDNTLYVYAIKVIPAPAKPTISGEAEYTEGATISLTATCSNGADASTTYTWYKGATWNAATKVQNAADAAHGGNVFTKTAASDDSGVYWCEASNGGTLKAHNETGKTISVVASSCTKPGTPTKPALKTDETDYLTQNSAILDWDREGATANSNGYKVYIVQKDNSSNVIADWVDCNNTYYQATSLTPATTYTITVKAKGATGYCDLGDASESFDFTTNSAPIYSVTYMPNGGSGSDIIDANAITIADCVFGTPENKLFDRWNATAEGDGADYTVGADVTSNLVLYAIWKDDECTTNRKSIFKAVLTGDNTATVTGENDKEYAGEVKLNKLGGSASNRNTDATIEGVGEHLTTYKMNGTGAYMYGTLKKGAFQEGDKIQFAVSSTPGTLAIYGAKSSDLSQRVHIANMPAPNAAKVYTYTLTAANATALAGYDAIGIYRADGVTMNPFLYSLEITGCRDWTILYSVSFDLNGQTSASPAPADQSIGEGGLVTKPTDPAVDGYYFRGWYKEAACTNAWDFANDAVGTEDVVLYAKWEVDPCPSPLSLSKVVLTSASDGTVTGYNGNEYAGEKVIGGLNSTETAEVDPSHEGVETGYKLNSGGSAIVFATLKKGTFQEGDRVVVTITKKQDAYKVEEVAQPILDIYYGTDKNDATFLTTIENVTAAGSYTYRLTAADVTAIGSKKGIGVFRPSSGRTQNPYVYSVEIKGCREWAVSHTVTYNKMDKGADIAPAVVEEGALVPEPSVTEPEGWILEGWYKEEGLVNKWDFASNVMGTSNITLYAKWVADASIKLIVDATPSGKKINDEAYYTGSPLTNVTISTVEYPCVKLAGGAAAATAPYSAEKNDNRVIAYCATTTATKIQVIAYSSSNSARPYTISFVEEGQTADQADDNNVIVNLPTDGTIHTSDWYQFNSSKNRTIYITIPGNASNYHFLQVKVIESGTPIKKAGDLGYSMNFNIGRPIGVKQTLHKNFEGFDFYANNDYKVLQSTSMVISNATNDYIKFHAAAPMTLAVSTENAASFYVTKTAKGTDNETLSTAGGISYIDLDEAADWYISPKGGEVKIQKIEFIAPKCEQPNVTDMSDSELCEGDPFTALAVSASVSDGGTLHYQWYKHPAAGDDEAVGADAASYTPTADGQYYVVVTNKLADHSDNSKASNTVTVEHFASAVITTAPLNQRGEVGDVVTLSAAATGKNVAYKWYTCDEDGSNEVALDPAQTGTSIDVTITAGLLQWYKVKVTSDCGGAEAKAKVSEFVPTTPANVTTSILWDWTSSAWPASGEVQFTNKTEDGTDLTPAYELLADADAIVPNNAAFRSDMLYGKGQWVWRSGNKFFQGTAIKFNTTVAGKVRVNYRSTGNNKEVQVTIAGTPAGKNKTSNFQWSEYVEVPAGDVEIICLSTDAEKSLTRVQKIEFLALAHQRTSGYNAGDLGTVCLEDETFIEGANLYELAGLDEHGYLAFDEIQAGELEEGKPYLFEVTNPSKISFYKPVGAAHTDMEVTTGTKGMIGTFSGTTLYQNVTENYYYFSGRHIWKVNDFTVAIPIPGHRCYIDYDVLKNAQASPNPAPGRRRVTLGVQGTQVTTDINNVGSDDVQCTKVMIDGQLYILRGEKMYDATGRLVK